MNKKMFVVNQKEQRLPAVGTLEVVIIIAVLLTIALLFRSQITQFASTLIDKVFNDAILGDF